MICHALSQVPPAWQEIARRALTGQSAGAPRNGQTLLRRALIVIGGCGGIAFLFEVDGGGWYSPYYSQSDNADDARAIARNPGQWLTAMAGATDWPAWTWDGPYADIPTIY
jgi:hypothetical protein